MTKNPTLSAASRMAADRRDKLMVSPRELALMDDFQVLENQAYRVRRPRIAVVSGSASYGPPTATIDVTD
ncbi:MAG TPA: hypothetical protein VFE63_10920, partial [Roseiarcus sp.]|nr:hypothetical protein [Roseiarcus sp.]